MPDTHALLSASSSSRWSVCTAAPRFEAEFPETTTSYAEEGRLAHEICELKAVKKFTTSLNSKTYAAKINKLKKNPLYSEEMGRASEIYIDLLTETAMSYDSPPSVSAELKVDFSEFVPEGFGTCDCAMIGGDILNVIDFKYGKGIEVCAENNSQLRLYALGALAQFAQFYSGITRVKMSIVQPNVTTEHSSETLTVSELREWGEKLKPVAREAFSGFGKFVPGTHCKFCRGNAVCRVRADANIVLEEFKSLPFPQSDNLNSSSNTLTFAEIGDLLVRGQNVVSWYSDMKDFALKTLLNGEEIPGWKAVAGRSVRAFTDADKAIETVINSGYDEAVVYEREAKSLAKLEKLMGKEEFDKILGKFVIKPPGKPSLAPMSDKREPYNCAANDFAGIKPDD